jgi:hypothetical protein
MYKIIWFLALISISLKLNAQIHQLVCTGGDFFQTSQFSISWSLGEPITETFSNNNIVLTQGFQQGLMDDVGITDDSRKDLMEIDVYPNPTDGMVNVCITNSQLINPEMNLNYSIYNLQGQLMRKGVINSSGGQIDFLAFKQAAYLLWISSEKQELKKYTIVNKL